MAAVISQTQPTPFLLSQDITAAPTVAAPSRPAASDGATNGGTSSSGQTHQDVWLAAMFGDVQRLDQTLNSAPDGGVNACGARGWSALYAAAARNHAEAVKLLLRRGADILLPTDEGWTPLLVASHLGFVQIVQILLEHGADPSTCSRDGESAIDLAESSGKRTVTRLLRTAALKSQPAIGSAIDVAAAATAVVASPAPSTPARSSPRTPKASFTARARLGIRGGKPLTPKLHPALASRAGQQPSPITPPQQQQQEPKEQKALPEQQQQALPEQQQPTALDVVEPEVVPQMLSTPDAKVCSAPKPCRFPAARSPDYVHHGNRLSPVSYDLQDRRADLNHAALEPPALASTPPQVSAEQARLQAEEAARGAAKLAAEEAAREAAREAAKLAAEEASREAAKLAERAAESAAERAAQMAAEKVINGLSDELAASREQAARAALETAALRSELASVMTAVVPVVPAPEKVSPRPPQPDAGLPPAPVHEPPPEHPAPDQEPSYVPACIKAFYMDMHRAEATLDLARQNFHNDWISHPNLGGPGVDGPGADGFFSLIKDFFGPTIPDYTWKTEECLHVKLDVGDKYIHIGSAAGSPVGPFFGIDPPTGRSFHIMSIDIHWVIDGKVRETWHVEEWARAVAQLTGDGPSHSLPPLHDGQAINARAGPQVSPGTQLPVSDCPACIRALYFDLYEPDATLEVARRHLHSGWVSHPNLAGPGVAGPGVEGFFGLVKGFFSRIIPDIAWQTEAIFEIPCEVGAKYVHVGSVSGRPVSAFFGVDPPTGRSFHILAIDIHWVVDGKVKETWHVEEWDAAISQLIGDGPVGIPPLHDGQALNATPLPPKQSFLEGLINSLETATGVDLDGDGDVGMAGHSNSRVTDAPPPPPVSVPLSLPQSPQTNGWVDETPPEASVQARALGTPPVAQAQEREIPLAFKDRAQLEAELARFDGGYQEVAPPVRAAAPAPAEGAMGGLFEALSAFQSVAIPSAESAPPQYSAASGKRSPPLLNAAAVAAATRDAAKKATTPSSIKNERGATTRQAALAAVPQFAPTTSFFISDGGVDINERTRRKALDARATAARSSIRQRISQIEATHPPMASPQVHLSPSHAAAAVARAHVEPRQLSGSPTTAPMSACDNTTDSATTLWGMTKALTMPDEGTDAKTAKDAVRKWTDATEEAATPMGMLKGFWNDLLR